MASTIALAYRRPAHRYHGRRAINRMTQLGVPDGTRRFRNGASVQRTMNSQLILIVAAIATVYIVLGILYESCDHPLTSLLCHRRALGALLALELFNAPFSLIALIGIMLLVAL